LPRKTYKYPDDYSFSERKIIIQLGVEATLVKCLEKVGNAFEDRDISQTEQTQLKNRLRNIFTPYRNALEKCQNPKVITIMEQFAREILISGLLYQVGQEPMLFPELPDLIC